MTTVLDLRRIRRAHRRFLTDNEALIRGALWHAGKSGVQEVYRNPGFQPQTGETQKATDYKIVRTKRRRVLRLRNRGKLAHILDKGSKPHPIRPLGPWPLRFKGRDGEWVSTWLVEHPGTRPYRFLGHAANVASRKLRDRIRGGARMLARRFGR